MDQYVINLKLAMLYFDLLDLIKLIHKSGNKELICYLDYLKDVVEQQSGDIIDYDEYDEYDEEYMEEYMEEDYTLEESNKEVDSDE